MAVARRRDWRAWNTISIIGATETNAAPQPSTATGNSAPSTEGVGQGDAAAAALSIDKSQNTAFIEAVSVADIEAEIAHIEQNGGLVKALPGMEDEGRCRELCAMYLREFIHHLRMERRLVELALPQSAKRTIKNEKE